MNWFWIPTLIVSLATFSLGFSTLVMLSIKGKEVSQGADVFMFYMGVLSSYVVLTANYGLLLKKKIWTKSIWVFASVVVVCEFFASTALDESQYENGQDYTYVIAHFLLSIIPIVYTLRFQSNKIWR